MNVYTHRWNTNDDGRQWWWWWRRRRQRYIRRHSSNRVWVYKSQWNTEVKFTTILSNIITIVETKYIEYKNESCSYSCHHMYVRTKQSSTARQSKEGEREREVKKNILTRCAMICKKKMLSMSLCQIEQVFIYTHISARYFMCANKGKHIQFS